jgi:hypothetical protein
VAKRFHLLQLLGVAIMLAGAFVALQPRVAEWLTVSSCLDQGGSYNYQRGLCDREKSHPYIPWGQRSHHDRSVPMGAALVIGGFIVVFVGPWHRRPPQE